MTEYPEFQHWPKISRLSKESCTITEKIDGTNGIIYITEAGEVLAGSRNRWLRPLESDNYGFRAWVEANAKDLALLGPGFHYGEWYGQGIQRGYGLSEKRFALFGKGLTVIPTCCSVVPWLYSGEFTQGAVKYCLDAMNQFGSRAVHGFMKPEGIVVHLHDAGKRYKVLLENDTLHKFEVTTTDTTTKQETIHEFTSEA